MYYCPNSHEHDEFVAFDCAVVIDKEGEIVTAARNEAYDPTTNISEPMQFICLRCWSVAIEEDD